MQKKVMGIFIAAALVLGVSGTCFSAGFGFGGPQEGPQRFGAPLTPEQRQLAEQLYNDNYAATNSLREALAAKRAELDKLLAGPTADAVQIEALSREIGELRGKLLTSRMQLRAQLQQNGLPADSFGPAKKAPKKQKFQQGQYWGNDQGQWHRGPGPRRHHHDDWGRHGRMDGPYGCPCR